MTNVWALSSKIHRGKSCKTFTWFLFWGGGGGGRPNNHGLLVQVDHLSSLFFFWQNGREHTLDMHQNNTPQKTSDQIPRRGENKTN